MIDQNFLIITIKLALTHNLTIIFRLQVLYHQGWTQAVEKAITGLKSSLLVEHPETQKLYVNMDPHVWELLRETRIMILMELDVRNRWKYC